MRALSYFRFSLRARRVFFTRCGFFDMSLLKLAGAGYPAAVRALEQTAHWLGLCVASAANLFAPQVIVIGGSLVQLGDQLLNAAGALLDEWALPFPGSPPRLVFAAHGADAGLIGAAVATEFPSDF